MTADRPELPDKINRRPSQGPTIQTNERSNMTTNGNDNRGNLPYLRTIKKAVQRHIEAGSADPIRDAIRDTYPVTGEIMARANRAWLMGEADKPNDIRIS